MSKILVNAVGDACPIPVTKTIHALSGMTEAGTVEVMWTTRPPCRI